MLVAIITYLRFCGEPALPPKSQPPSGPVGTQRQLLSQTTSSPGVYREYLERDSATAGVRVPTADEMSRKLAYRVDESRHVLEPGQPAIEAAGLRLRVERAGNAVVMTIQNLVDSDVGYEVASSPSTGTYICNSARPLSMNAMVIVKGGTETRTECVWREGMSIVVTKVETIEAGCRCRATTSVTRLPPTLVGIEERIARGHHGVSSKEPCSAVISQVVRTGMDRGDISWRDLVDFYARHRCQTYQFPSSYRAFNSDGERAIPAAE